MHTSTSGAHLACPPADRAPELAGVANAARLVTALTSCVNRRRAYIRVTVTLAPPASEIVLLVPLKVSVKPPHLTVPPTVAVVICLPASRLYCRTIGSSGVDLARHSMPKVGSRILKGRPTTSVLMPDMLGSVPPNEWYR